jgi:hypothetical protein
MTEAPKGPIDAILSGVHRIPLRLILMLLFRPETIENIL